MADIKNRLGEIMAERKIGLDELARRAKTTAGTVSKLKNGRMRLTLDWVTRLADALGVDPREILSEPAPRVTFPEVNNVPLVGYVGAGDLYYADPEVGAWQEIEFVDGPNAEGVVAVRVRGHSMAPHYKDGWLVYFSKNDAPETEWINDDCVVETEDGRAYLKHVKAGSRPGVYNLESFSDQPTLEDVKLKWAARVEWIRRGRR